MKLRDFTLTTNELPPTNVCVLGYWEGLSAPYTVVYRDADGIWWAHDDEDDYIAPTSWSHLPGGIELNTAGLPDWPAIDLGAEV